MRTQFPLLDTHQAAYFLNVRRQTMDAWRCQQGKGPTILHHQYPVHSLSP